MIITINERNIEVAESWNELSLNQLLQAYQVLMSDTDSIFTQQEVMPTKRIVLLMILLDVDQKFMDSWEQDCINTYGDTGTREFLDELNELLPLTDFFFTEVEQTDEEIEQNAPKRYHINLALTKCPYPQFKFPRKKKKERWYAPADGLENITILEMGKLFAIYEDGMKNHDDYDWVDNLLAVMYRPGKPDTKHNRRTKYEGDRRLDHAMVEHLEEKRAKKIAMMPDLSKQLLLFWFASCREQIVEMYPLVFQEGSGDGEPTDWSAILLHLANGLSYLKVVSEQNHHNALMFLTQVEKERMEQKRKRGKV